MCSSDLTNEELALRIAPYFFKAGYEVDQGSLIKIAPIIKERITTLDEAVGMAGFFFKEEIAYNSQDLIGKGLDVEQTRKILGDSFEILSGLENLNLALAETQLREYVEKSGLSAGQIFGVLRVAVTGQKVSPPLFESMEIIGKEKVIERIKNALEMLS